MAGVDVDVHVRSRLDKMATELAKEMDSLVQDAAKWIRDEARDSMKEPKTGRLYPGGHIASAPGQAPGIRPFPIYPTGGELYASLYARRTGFAQAQADTDIDSAKYLEWGTSKMAPRPFFRPAAKKVQHKVGLVGGQRITIALNVPW